MIRHSRMTAIIGAAALAGTGVLRREPTDEERAANDAKIDAQRHEAEREHRRERAAYWAGVEASNAAKADSALNRRTGKPHEHNRAKARRLRQTA